MRFQHRPGSLTTTNARSCPYMLLVDAISLLLAAWLAVLMRSLFSPRLSDPQYYALIPTALFYCQFLRASHPGNGTRLTKPRTTTTAISVVMILLSSSLPHPAGCGSRVSFSWLSGSWR